MEPEDLVRPGVVGAAESLQQRMRRVIQTHDDGFLDITAAMIRSSRADHMPELGPVLQGRPLPLGEGQRGAMHSHQAAAPRDEFEEVLSAGRLRHAGTDIVVKEDRVETAQGLPVEHRRVFANDGLEGPRPLAKKPEGFAAGQDGGAVAVVFEVAVEDEQPARLGM